MLPEAQIGSVGATFERKAGSPFLNCPAVPLLILFISILL